MTTEVGRVTSTGATAAAGSVPLLRLEGLKVWFPIRDGIIRQRHVGDVQAVDGVTFEIERGEHPLLARQRIVEFQFHRPMTFPEPAGRASMKSRSGEKTAAASVCASQ